MLLVESGLVDDGHALRKLAPGRRLSFGRGTSAGDVDLRLDDPSVSRRAGEIVAGPTYWYLSNWSDRATYVVENMEGTGEYVRVRPRRAGVPVPFELARVLLPAADGTIGFQAYAPALPMISGAGPGEGDGAATEVAFPLDRHAKYFLVLVALCEPRLRGDWLATSPTASQVAERLRPLPECADLTPRAVDFHTDYLARHKVRLRTPDDDQSGFTSRRTALVEFALRFGLVVEDDLTRLPARSPVIPLEEAG